MRQTELIWVAHSFNLGCSVERILPFWWQESPCVPPSPMEKLFSEKQYIFRNTTSLLFRVK